MNVILNENFAQSAGTELYRLDFFRIVKEAHSEEDELVMSVKWPCDKIVH